MDTEQWNSKNPVADFKTRATLTHENTIYSLVL